MKNFDSRSWLLALCFLIFGLIGCATSVPVHELESPEVLGPWGFRAAYFSGSSPAMATKEALASPDNKGYTLPISGFKFGFGIHDRFQVNSEAMLSGGASGSGISSLKWQYEGKPYFQTQAGDQTKTVVLKFWNSVANNFTIDDISDDGIVYPYADLELKGYTLSHLWGYRFTQMNGVYGGPQLIQAKLDAKYKNSDEGAIVKRTSRNVTGYGLLAGYYFAGLGDHIGFDFALEGQFSRLPGTYNSKAVNYTSFSLLVGIPFRF